MESLSKLFESLAASMGSLATSVESLSKGGASLLASLGKGFESLATWVTRTARSVVIAVLGTAIVIALVAAILIVISLIVSPTVRVWATIIVVLLVLRIFSEVIFWIARLAVAFVIFVTVVNLVLPLIGVAVLSPEKWEWPTIIREVPVERIVEIRYEVPQEARDAVAKANEAVSRLEAIDGRVTNWLATGAATHVGQVGEFISLTLASPVIVCQHPGTDLKPSGACAFLEKDTPNLQGLAGEGLSWVHVAAGFRATCYKKPDFEGEETIVFWPGTWQWNTPEFPDEWNDQLRSCKISPLEWVPVPEKTEKSGGE